MSEPIVEKEAGPPAAANNQGGSGTPTEEKKKREYKDFGHDEEKATRGSFIKYFLTRVYLFSRRQGRHGSD